MRIVPAIADKNSEYASWRKRLHSHPEIAFEERETSAFVADKLRSWGIEVHEGLARTGVVGRLRAGASHRTIGLRADMDALPMQELNDFAHRSKTDGHFHGCGHDGHTVMLLAAAEYLARTKNFDGTVHFVFQPAEENAGGGRVMVVDGLFERFPCDEIYALHNWPDLPFGKIAVRGGAVMAATDRWDLEVVGKAGHAAFPQHAIDPIYVGTQIVQAWQGLVSRETTPTSPVVISTTKFHAGSAYNVIPERAELAGTARTLDPELQDRLERRMEEVAGSVARAWNANVTFDYQRGYPVTVNDVECANHAASVAAALVGAEDVVREYPPSLGGEDFSFMLQQRPGAYLWLGQGAPSHSAPLHSARYDFNDAALPLGASLHVELVESRLSLQG